MMVMNSASFRSVVPSSLVQGPTSTLMPSSSDRSGSRTHSTSPTRDNKAAPTAAEAMKTVRLSFEEHPKESLHVMLFDQVANSSELLERIKAGQFEPEATVVDGELVMDLFPLTVAANKALTSNAREDLVTRSLHAELLHNLSGTKHIVESLKRFGISPKSDKILVAKFNASDEDVQKLRELVKGKEVDVEMLPQLADVDRIKQLYGISPEETQAQYIVDSIIMKMATKNMS